MTTIPQPQVTTLYTATNWPDGAACKGLDTESFYLPDMARCRNKRRIEAAAKAICNGCPVVSQCLNFALQTQEPYGVWGGMTPEEREDLAEDRYPVAA